jgi:hypothetical protein
MGVELSQLAELLVVLDEAVDLSEPDAQQDNPDR